MRVPRVFFDTNHVRYIANASCGRGKNSGSPAYRRLSAAIRANLIVPVVPLTQTFEWSNHKDPRGADELAATVEAGLPPYVVDPFFFVAVRELLMASKEIDSNIRLEVPEILRPMSARGQATEFLRQWFSHVSFETRSSAGMHPRKKVQIATVREQLGYARRIVDAERAAGDDPRREFEESFWLAKPSVGAEKGYSVGQLRGVVSGHFRLGDALLRMGCSLSPSEIIDRIDFERCPGFRLHYAVYWQYQRSRPVGTKPGDFNDLAQIHVVPYVDVALLDREMTAYVKQSRRSGRTQVLSDAARAVEWMDGVVEPSRSDFVARG